MLAFYLSSSNFFFIFQLDKFLIFLKKSLRTPLLFENQADLKKSLNLTKKFACIRNAFICGKFLHATKIYILVSVFLSLSRQLLLLQPFFDRNFISLVKPNDIPIHATLKSEKEKALVACEENNAWQILGPGFFQSFSIFRAFKPEWFITKPTTRIFHGLKNLVIF